MKPLLSLLCALALSACLSQSEPSDIYLLKPVSLTQAAPADHDLEVSLPSAAPGLNSDRIALKRAAHSLEYYAHSRWARNLPEVVQSAMLQSLEQSGVFRSVSNDETGAAADLLLAVTIHDFQTEYSSRDASPHAQVTLSIKLLDTASHKVLSSFTTRTEAVAADNKMEQIIASFNSAFEESLRLANEKIVEFLAVKASGNDAEPTE